MAGVRPSGAEIASVVERATAARRQQVRADPTRAHFTEHAITERIVGLVDEPRPGARGWWLVGRLVDGMSETELKVWRHPGARRIGLRECE